jgi:hypothetical protein
MQLTIHSEVLGEGFGRDLALAHQEWRKRSEVASLNVPDRGRRFLVGPGGIDWSCFAAEVNFHRPHPDLLSLKPPSDARGSVRR